MRRALVVTLGLLALAAPAQAARFPDVRSPYGSGVFGKWGVDGLGLPRYRYTLDEETAKAAQQPELNGNTAAWHQVGNDHVVADAFNHGWTQLWSQDRLYQWANYVEPDSQHYGGAFGWLRAGGKTYSTLYDDRAKGAKPTRDFGVGYFGRRTKAGAIRIDERVYAPFGDDSVLLHDVSLRNTTKRIQKASWFEYWDVNPYFPGAHSHLGIAAPVYDKKTRTITVAQQAHPQDSTPGTIYAAALSGPDGGFETDGSAFFGAGDRKEPAAVKADKLAGSLAAAAPDAGLAHTVAVFRAPVTLKPGAAVTLRYAYGMTAADKVAKLVAKRRAVRGAFARSERAWRAWLPRTELGAKRRWIARELAWDAYLVRSGTTYEECAGHHIISQGGYYQYDMDFQGAFRDPLQHMLPMIYTDPFLAREVLLYSAAEQPAGGGQIPYARIARCTRFDLGTSDDLDLWLLLSAAEYGLATRDLKFFDQQVPWEDGSTATLWEHLKAGFSHQESQRGPHGGYIIGGTGDWSDFSTQFLGMTESILVAAQAAYIYPRLAELADARGDKAFAMQLRDTADGLKKVLQAEWTGKGWFSRGYSAVRQLGQGVIFGEPQPWGLLAGAVDAAKETTLVANIRRFLTGIGAPGGPSKIGSSQSPAADDPDVTETSAPGGVGNNHAVYVGGAWYAINGWLTWALAELDGIVPNARAYAWDEFVRNTNARRATVYPEHWDGILSVDDACRSWYSDDPANCGVGLSSAYNTQIMHQPAWALFDAVRLAGMSPTADGYRVVPHLPFARFSLRLPEVGVTSRPGALSGYVRVVGGGTLRMRVAAPPGTAAPSVVASAGGRRVDSRVENGLIVFDLPTTAGRVARWSVTAPKGSR